MTASAGARTAPTDRGARGKAGRLGSGPARLLPWLVLALALAGAMHEALQWRRAAAFNAAIVAPLPADPLGDSGGIAPEVLFARGHRAARDGRAADALALYTAAARDPRLAAAALYNGGNLHLRESFVLAERQALALTPQPIELAKRQFRDALRADPAFWAARYNLERALRLAPEPEEEEGPPPPPRQSERAVTTMRGFTLGLP